MLADGGDCVRDLAGLRQQPELFGEVCSTSTAWRVLAWEVGGCPRQVAALWSALARVRERAWALGAAPIGPLVIDLDATLIQAHSDKQGAAGTYKGGFGFHSLGAWLDRGDGTGEALSGVLRPGNAASNTAQDHLDVLAMALLADPGGQFRGVLVGWSGGWMGEDPACGLVLLFPTRPQGGGCGVDAAAAVAADPGGDCAGGTGRCCQGSVSAGDAGP